MSQEQVLSNDLEVIEKEIIAYQKVIGDSILEIGKRLKYVKEKDLVHGEWGKWLDRVGVNRRTANRYIKVYNIYGDREKDIKGVESSKLFEFSSFDNPIDALKHKNKTVKEIRKLKRQISSKENKSKVKECILNNNSIYCKCCHVDCTPIVEWHHIVPISNGGENTEENVIPVCPNCHAVIHRLLSSMNEGIDLNAWLKTKYNVESRELIYKLVDSILDSKLKDKTYIVN